MRKICVLLAVLAWYGNPARGQAPAAATPPLIVIRAGTLIDGQSDTTKKTQLIFIRGGRIE